MEKTKLSIVSYLNTIPLQYGIDNCAELLSQIYLTKNYPAECVRKIIHNEVDAGLASVAIIPKLEKYQIVSDFCIATEDVVESVLLCSNIPIGEIENIILDYQSETSNMLVQILAKKYWNINPHWLPSKAGYELNMPQNSAALIIGDRCFQYRSTFKYSYDLGHAWHNLTGLPFVFACWISKTSIPDKVRTLLNTAQRQGINNIEKAIATQKVPQHVDISYYLHNNISYAFDKKKEAALDFFLKEIAQISPNA